MIKLHFPIEPVAKGRPRTTKRGHVYTPKKTADFEREISALVTMQMHLRGHEPYAGPLSVRCYFFLRKPKKPKHEQPIGRPDADNLIKSVLDALNGVVWIDDSQICNLATLKAYSDKPSITLFVYEGVVAI